jgi:hypothetical protein
MIRVLHSVYAYKVSYVKIRAYDSKNIMRMIRMLELCLKLNSAQLKLLNWQFNGQFSSVQFS